MIDLTKPKYVGTKLGFKVRAHRIIIQMIVVLVMLWFFGLGALILSVMLFYVEIIPYKNWERWLNPWLHRECKLDIGTKFEEWLQKEIKRDFGDDETDNT